MSLSEGDKLLYAFRKNVVVAASAGTGKTHRLTGLYVALALGLTEMIGLEPAPGARSGNLRAGAVDPARIVATTFSRAAAVEIRTRIEKALRSVAAGEPEPPLAEILVERLQGSGESLDGLREGARAALDSMPRARIDTLHSVAQSIVRTHALRMGLAPQARIEDQDETKQIVFGAVDRTLSEALDGAAESADAARELIRATSGLDRLREDIRGLFDRMDEDGLDAGALGVQDHLAHARERWAELHRVARACVSTVPSRNSGKVAKELLQLVPVDPPSEIADHARDTIERFFAVALQSKHTAEADLGALWKSLAKVKRDAPRNLLELVSSAPQLEARERAMVVLISRVRELVIAERTRRGVLSFGDLLRLVRKSLTDDDLVWGESRREIDALFVDEFQDTSLVQRDIVYLLRETNRGREERRAKGPGAAPSAREIRPSGLFLVGDRKQSIYAFRGADVSVFSRVAIELGGNPAREALGFPTVDIEPAPMADFLTLTESRRSVPEIVDFVNLVSRADFDRGIEGTPQDFEIKYGQAEELVSIADAGAGRVLLLADDGSVLPSRSSRALSREAQVAALVVARMIRDGIPRRDIAVLARRRATIPLIEQALSDGEIRFVVAGRALYQTQEVRDAAAFLRLLLDPRDRHSIATVLRGPFVELSDTALLALTSAGGLDQSLLSPRGQSTPDWALLEAASSGEEVGRLRAFRDRFLETNEALRRMTPSEAIREALRMFDIDRMLAALPRPLTTSGNIERLIEIAAKQGGSVASFSRWLDRQIEDETDEAEAVVFSAEDDAVRLTTIHGSKGLDFEAVVLVDVNAGPGVRAKGVDYALDRDNRRATLIVKHKSERGIKLSNRASEEASKEARAREQAERRRLSYVAITRAKRELALVLPDRSPKSESLMKTLSELVAVGLEPIPQTPLAEWLAAGGDDEPGTDAGPELEPQPENLDPLRVTAKRLALATTPLSVFKGCERRFQLRFLIGLEEPVASGQLALFDEGAARADDREESAETSERDPRSTGRAAHRWLETLPRERWGTVIEEEEIREALLLEGATASEAPNLAMHLRLLISGPWARRVASTGAELHREEEIGIDLGGTVDLHLRGTIDLYAVDGDRIEIVDYKLGRPKADLAPYAFQLRSYAHGLSLSHPGARIRAGIVFLHGSTEPSWLGSGGDFFFSDEDQRKFADELAKLADQFATARSKQTFRPKEVTQCRSLGCGFITSCHPKRAEAKRRGG